MSGSRSSSPSNGELASTLVELLRQQQRQSEAQQAILMGMLEQQKQNFESHKAEVTSLLGRPPINADRQTKVPPPLLQKLQPSDDIEQFLAVFERVARQQEWPNETWSTQLAALLTGKARDAYIALPFEDTKDFDNVKSAILKRYEINEETHRRKFRADRKRDNESHREFMDRLRDRFQRWIKSQQMPVEDLIVLEQFYQSLPNNLAIWLRDHKPGSLQGAADLADDYLLSRAPTQVKEEPGSSVSTKHNKEASGERKCFVCKQPGHLARDCPQRQARDHKASKGPQGTREKEITCYNCHHKGHVSSKCPNNAMFCTSKPDIKENGLMKAGTVEGQQVSKILLDTGCSRTMVRRELVPPEKLLEGEAVTIRCAHGDMVLYPLAKIGMEVNGKHLEMEVAVSDTLPVDVLLGTDAQELPVLLGELPRAQEPQVAMVVVTRSKALQSQKEEIRSQECERECGVRPHSLEEPETTLEEVYSEPDIVAEDSNEQELAFCEFSDDLFSPAGRSKTRFSRSQKRAARLRFAQAREHPRHTLDLDASNLKTMQEDDESLKQAWEAARGKPNCAVGPGFFIKDGLLHRKAGKVDQFEQVVVPLSCRQDILRLAHEVPLAGHLGKNKTAKRILNRFYWPTLFRDVRDYCRSCPNCQKASGRKGARAPLIPLPIMSVPFQRIAMDIVGPLPKSRKGNRYILVVCDYATRYPEAIPLRSIEAETIAEELVQLFSRIGIPQEILTDQGSNFTSRLLQELYKLLHVHPIRTSPYHPQTDGLVERFNQTLKTMLRKAAVDEGKDWDRLVPYLLFAYREVPQDSTGFSPFELLYGRSVRGPLDILKESWVASERADESVVSHILDMREKLSKMQAIVQDNLKGSQQQQKRWYDKSARQREFQQGDQVLVLLPTSTNKLLAQWQGPYKVKERVGNVNYLVEMHDRRKKHRIFHVNMLKKWYTPVGDAYLAMEDSPDVDNEEDVPVWNENDTLTESEPTMGSQLNLKQRQELEELLYEYREVMKNKPGKTTIVEHAIDTGSATPVRLPPYRLPHAYKDAVYKEIQDMLQAGMIEPSTSCWASPIVPVRKKDGSIRLCVDYRRLNSVSKHDAYPMPRIDDIIDRVGGAKYISALDLTRGYWQVPMSAADRHKTAFTTPMGLFQFTVMPFGLSGAPATFQRMMDQILNGLQKFSSAYLDDVVVFSDTWEEHLKHLRNILERLRSAGLTAKLTKCQFGMAECRYLGHIVGSGVVRPEYDKIRAVRTFQVPRTKKEVRTFLGITGYYRKFIQGYAATAAPLTDLTKKASPNLITWTDECQVAFQKLKDALCTAPVLRSPNFDLPFILQTDASDRGVAAVLSQTEQDEEHPIAYFSKKLLPREQKYSTIEKECLAIKLGMQAFRVYLLGRVFSVQTDHRALEWLNQLKDSNYRLSRWSLALQPFQFKVIHRAGQSNGNADALSRMESHESNTV